MTRFVGLCVIVVVACSPDSWDRPAPIIPTKDNPCGARWIECPTSHGCCIEGVQTCGGEPASVGCPAGMCCDIDNGMLGAQRSDAGTMTPQRRP